MDNGSTDNSVAVAQHHGVDVIPLTENHGFAYAVNRGIEASGTDWVAILNNDITIPADWLDRVAGWRRRRRFRRGQTGLPRNVDN